nr:Chain C, peptide epitope [synthetic construct]
ELDKWKSL